MEDLVDHRVNLGGGHLLGQRLCRRERGREEGRDFLDHLLRAATGFRHYEAVETPGKAVKFDVRHTGKAVKCVARQSESLMGVLLLPLQGKAVEGQGTAVRWAVEGQ